MHQAQSNAKPNTKILVNQVYRLFEEPSVYITCGRTGIDWVIRHGERNSICLINLMWMFSARSLCFYGPKVRKLKASGIIPVIIGHTSQDMFLLRLFGFRAVLANQNQFIVEDNIPLRSARNHFDYDAFYAAQAKPFKRMHLAQEVEKLYILTYGWTKEFNEARDLSKFEPRVSHASYNKTYLEFDEISRIMHQSACALALSRKEGPMWATVEGLLSGLPVVSTKSKGGRDRYFDPRTVRIVPANPQAVREAVEHFKSNPPDPAEVRRITLEKIKADRKVTVKYFQDKILVGAGYSDADVYCRLFQDGTSRTPLEIREITQ